MIEHKIVLTGKAGVAGYLGNHVRKDIRIKKSSEDADILLNYPVVYIHTWRREDGSWRYYVGETINLVKRTDQHDKDENGWHNDWKSAMESGRECVSFYFSDINMNKSLCLDIEDRLIALFEEAGLNISNSRDNEQCNYNNKYLAAGFTNHMIRILKENGYPVDGIKETEKDPKPQNLEDDLEPEYIDIPMTVSGWEEEFRKHATERKTQFLNYPVVYMHIWTENGKKCTYVGETNDIIERTWQHLNNKESNSGFITPEFDGVEWTDNAGWHGSKRHWISITKGKNADKASMIVFAHPQFNKSMTLDLENRLIQYTIFGETAKNGRTNEQGEYSNKELTYDIFNNIVNILHGKNKDLFRSLADIQKEAVFMASPLMELTSEQKRSEEEIKQLIIGNNEKDEADHSLVVICGGAGTGKTVLLSSLFFDLLLDGIDCRLIVNHSELYKTYYSMTDAWKLGRKTVTSNKLIWKAESFINSFEKEVQKPDIVLVDEGHLLYSRGGMGASAAQLPRIVKKAKVTVLVFDPGQFVENGKCWEWNNAYGIAEGIREQFEELKNIPVTVFELSGQMRVKCADVTRKWLKSLCTLGSRIHSPVTGGVALDQDGYVSYIDDTGYEIRIYKNISDMKNEIADREKPSCLLATFDWPYYKEKTSCATIKIEGTAFRWHTTGDSDAMEKAEWTFQSKPDEVGAYHDIQGFDLNYAGVILGPSVTYSSSEGIGFIKTKSGQLVHQGGLPEEKSLYSKLIANEVGVLLSRAMKGLYIYACDPSLREALLNTGNIV